STESNTALRLCSTESNKGLHLCDSEEGATSSSAEAKAVRADAWNQMMSSRRSSTRPRRTHQVAPGNQKQRSRTQLHRRQRQPLRRSKRLLCAQKAVEGSCLYVRFFSSSPIPAEKFSCSGEGQSGPGASQSRTRAGSRSIGNFCVAK